MMRTRAHRRDDHDGAERSGNVEPSAESGPAADMIKIYLSN